MEFDMASFVIGMLTTIVVATLYVAIAEAFERRQKWSMIESDLLSRNPSEEFWGRRINSAEMDIESSESEIVRIISNKP